MTPKEQAAMQQALEALENERSHMTANWDNIVKAITALREALAEQADISALPIIIEAAVKEAVLAEREACAKVCDEFGVWRDTSGVDCAAAIRGRGEK